MSIEVNSYEELHICNVNGKTTAICGLVDGYKKLSGAELTEYGFANVFVN